ncbi:MAG: OmpA family protein [Deltaproteobacteria bacterium]|nr:OmpA family protein [Deltaproteobacteria bacterium]
MQRLSSLVLATIVTEAVVGLWPATAAADTTQLGLWFGPRVYSDDSRLGYIPDAPFHPTLNNAIEFGVRVARPFLPWLVPELELAMAPTGTNAVGGAQPADVFWIEPRLHLRLELAPTKRILPFLIIGGGSPISISAAQKTFASGIVGEGYIGAGVRFDTLKGFGIRLDARVSFLPGLESRVTSEVDVGIGLVFDLGRYKKRTAVRVISPTALDKDGDGVPDLEDKCADRLEDLDGFDDRDGCPDIDNDLDGVLDIADKCPNVVESYNGFEDDNGCPDVVPPDVDALRGTIEGLIYADGETGVRDSATPGLMKIVKVMQAHPSIRVVLIGHTDTEEAKQFATTPAPGEPPSELATLSADLSRARAEAVKQAFAPLGIPPGRIEIEARGSEEPVADNDRPRGRLANRRVEIRLYVPLRTKN